MKLRGSLRRTLIGVALLTAALFWGRSGWAGGIVLHELMSPSIARNTVGISSLRRVLVYLPDNYNRPEERYPVLYWIPGWQNWATEEYRLALDAAMEQGVIPPTIVVSIDTHEGIVFLNSSEFGYWEDFLLYEVIPFIDRTYPTIPSESGRALMGHSIGGYAAMILPMRHPNVWGAVGLNDGSVWAGGDFLPPWRLPFSFDSYKDAGSIPQVFIQMGIAITPNPNAPLHFDLPFTTDRVPEVASKWEAYCPQNRETIAKYRDELRHLAMIAVIVPETALLTNRQQNIEMIENMRAEGIAPTRLDMPGEHDGHRNERFIALARQALSALANFETRVIAPLGKQALLWADLKLPR